MQQNLHTPENGASPRGSWALTGTLMFALAACGMPLPALAAFPQLGLELVSSGELNTPIGMTHAGDGSGRLFTIDQRGKIQILQNGSVLATPFLDLGAQLVPQRVTGGGQPNFDERGLLGMAFHPEFASPGAAGEGKFYVFYTAPRPPEIPTTPENPVDSISTIAEYRVSNDNPNVADPASGRILMTFNKPQFNHNGGQLAFGPDGYLYISTGDGGGSNDNDPGHTGGGLTKPSGVLGNAQDRTNLLGKILRVDVNSTSGPNGQYGIPGDNPFVGAGGGVKEEIFAYGLRNPWRFSFDDGPGGDGKLYAADVGQNFYEEINIIEKGGNYGWRIREGFHDFDASVPAPGVPLLDPIAEYSHPNAPEGTKIGISATGGFVYRGELIPGLEGKYIFGDWSTSFGAPQGHLLGLEKDDQGNWQLVILDILGGNPIPFFINSFGRDEDGELYVLGNLYNRPNGLPGGVIFRIVPEPTTAMLFMAISAAWAARRTRRR